MTRHLSSAVLRILAAVMLAVVGMHAFAPVATPLERHAGSAFSSATHDVSLTGKRKANPEAKAAADPDSGRTDGDILPVPRLEPALPTAIVAATFAVPLAIAGVAVATGPVRTRGPPFN